MDPHKYEDEYDGIGGSYAINPKTGKREPVKAFKPITEPVTLPEPLAIQENDNGLEK